MAHHSAADLSVDWSTFSLTCEVGIGLSNQRTGLMVIYHVEYVVLSVSQLYCLYQKLDDQFVDFSFSVSIQELVQ